MADHGAVVTVDTKEAWHSHLKSAQGDGKVVIVDFTATWCGPCRLIGPEFVVLSTKFSSILFLKVDVDDVQEVAEQCGVNAMPTFQVFKDGKKVDELVGASKDMLLKLVEKWA